MHSLIPQHQYGIWIFAIAVAAAITLIVLAAQNALLTLFDPMRRRLRVVRGLDPGQGDGGLIAHIGAYVSPRSQELRDSLSLMLVRAGWRSGHALALMYAVKIAFALMLPIALLMLVASFPGEAPRTGLLLLMAGGAAFIGWLFPNLFLRQKIKRRQEAIFASFPDALDLLVACTEAGLGLNAAIERVADQSINSHPELADELGLVNAEVRAGIDRSTALRNLSHRVGLKDIRGLVALIMHAMKFGTSIADTLRAYASELRDRRVQHAEEMAAKIGTKLIFPLVLCIFPSFFLVAIGPAVIRLIDVFSKTGLVHH